MHVYLNIYLLFLFLILSRLYVSEAQFLPFNMVVHLFFYGFIKTVLANAEDQCPEFQPIEYAYLHSSIFFKILL